MKHQVGELFVLGFRGFEIPAWVQQFEHEFGLGGVILFDYNCQTRSFENNIQSPDQVRALCKQLSALNSRPLIMVDQEGGKVRRLKEKLGFAPLPSQLAFNLLPESEKSATAERSFRELRDLGFHYDLAPVIDLNINPKNPDIGAVERSYSANAAEVRANVEILDFAARRAGLGLCLKHYPGLGAATVNSHEELTDLSGTILPEQLRLFYDLGRSLHGTATLVSHGIVREWDDHYPVSMSVAGIERLRRELPEALLLSDDLQMQGLQKILPSPFPSKEACIQGLRAGLDMIIIGNNLMPEDELCLEYARNLEKQVLVDFTLKNRYLIASTRVRTRKALFSPK